jgi:hypothetical protein
MSTALELFGELGIEFIATNQQHRRQPMQTCCRGIVDRIIREHGVPHARLVLITIAETRGNSGNLIADIILAISDIARLHPRWAGGAGWLEAFDSIDLAEIRLFAKRTKVRPVRNAVMTLLCGKLEPVLGPSMPPKPPRPIKVKFQKPSLREADASKIRDNIRLGVELLKLKREVRDLRKFGQLVRHHFHIDPQRAAACMRAARVFGDRDDTIAGKLTWRAVLALSARSLPADIRRGFEQRALAGERIGAPEIRRARGHVNEKFTFTSKQRAPEPACVAA